MLRAGRLSAGHARALIVTPDPVALARQVVDQGLSVRETERLAKAPGRAPLPGRPNGPAPTRTPTPRRSRTTCPRRCG